MELAGEGSCWQLNPTTIASFPASQCQRAFALQHLQKLASSSRKRQAAGRPQEPLQAEGGDDEGGEDDEGGLDVALAHAGRLWEDHMARCLGGVGYEEVPSSGGGSSGCKKHTTVRSLLAAVHDAIRSGKRLFAKELRLEKLPLLERRSDSSSRIPVPHLSGYADFVLLAYEPPLVGADGSDAEAADGRARGSSMPPGVTQGRPVLVVVECKASAEVAMSHKLQVVQYVMLLRRVLSEERRSVSQIQRPSPVDWAELPAVRCALAIEGLTAGNEGASQPGDALDKQLMALGMQLMPITEASERAKRALLGS